MLPLGWLWGGVPKNISVLMAWERRKGVVRIACKTSSHSLLGNWCAGYRHCMPALVSKIDISCLSFNTRGIKAVTTSELARSHS